MLITAHMPSLSLSHEAVVAVSAALLVIFVLCEAYVYVQRRHGRKAGKGGGYGVRVPSVQVSGAGVPPARLYLRLGDREYSYPARHVLLHDPHDVDAGGVGSYSPGDLYYEQHKCRGANQSYSRSSSGVVHSSSSRVLTGVAHWTHGSGPSLYRPISYDLGGLDEHGPEAQAMVLAFPAADKDTLLRFLVTANGQLGPAQEAYASSASWRRANLPPPRDVAAKVYQTGAMFTFGVSRTGSPIYYFRGAFYDKSAGSVEEQVTACAYAIDQLVARSPTGLITIVAQACAVGGALNTPVDTDFVSAFVKMISAHYPDRLDRFLLYPFPWWGRAIWSFVSVFLNKRTQDRARLYSTGGPDAYPAELLQDITARNVPRCMGGAGNEDGAIGFLDMLDEDLLRRRQGGSGGEGGGGLGVGPGPGVHQVRAGGDGHGGDELVQHQLQRQSSDLSMPGMDIDAEDD